MLSDTSVFTTSFSGSNGKGGGPISPKVTGLPNQAVPSSASNF